MAATTQIHEVKTALVEAWALLPALSGVQIRSAPSTDALSAAYEWVQLVGEDDIEQEWAGLGNLARDESLRITGTVFVLKQGDTETQARAARARAVELMAAIEDYFTGSTGDPSIGGLVRMARANPIGLMEFSEERGRVAMLGFEIRTGPSRLVRS